MPWLIWLQWLKLMLFLEWMAKYTSWVLMFFDISTSALELAKVMIRLWWKENHCHCYFLSSWLLFNFNLCNDGFVLLGDTVIIECFKFYELYQTMCVCDTSMTPLAASYTFSLTWGYDVKRETWKKQVIAKEILWLCLRDNS